MATGASAVSDWLSRWVGVLVGAFQHAALRHPLILLALLVLSTSVAIVGAFGVSW